MSTKNIHWSKPTTITPAGFSQEEHDAVEPIFPWWGEWLTFRRFHLSVDGWSIGTVIEVREKKWCKTTYFGIGGHDATPASWIRFDVPADAAAAADLVDGWVQVIDRPRALTWAKRALAEHASGEEGTR